MVFVVILGYLLSVVLFIWNTGILADPWLGMTGFGLLMMLVSLLLFTATVIATCGFFTLQPGQARVSVLFGKYVGTVRD